MKNAFCLFVLLSGLICLPVNLFASQDLAPFKGRKGNIRIAGGTAHIPVMKEAAGRIITFNQAVHIAIAGGGSGLGIKQVGEGLIDIGNSGRKTCRT